MLRPELGPLAYQTRLEVKLFPFASAQPLEMLSVLPDHDRGMLFVHLRGRKLDQAELTVELFDGDRRTGAARVLLSAQPLQSIKPGQKIAVNLDVPSGAEPVGQWPITFGVPFPEGSLWDVSDLRLGEPSRARDRQPEGSDRPWSREGAAIRKGCDSTPWPRREEGCFVEAACRQAPSRCRPRPWRQ